jgi:hypothetical protein
MKYLEEHKIDLEEQPTELLVELAGKLKGNRDEKYPEDKIMSM